MKLNELKDKKELELPVLSVGDEVLIGRFKNRKAKIKSFSKDKKGQPLINTNKGTKKALNFNDPKLIP